MNNSAQAKNGFKTFILTLAVSLVLFSMIYYLATETSANVDIESDNTLGSTDTIAANVPGEAVRESAFEDLNKQKMDEPSRAVLAGTDETTVATQAVPDTGSEEITYALAVSAVITLLGGYFLIVSPRSRALRSFEEGVTKGL